MYVSSICGICGHVMPDEDGTVCVDCLAKVLGLPD